MGDEELEGDKGMDIQVSSLIQSKKTFWHQAGFLARPSQLSLSELGVYRDTPYPRSCSLQLRT